MTKAAHAVAHPFFDMKAILGLDSLKFPWNCSLTSATVGEASDAIAFTLPDGSLVADKYQELLNKAVTSMKGMKLMKGLDNKGSKMDLLVHPMTMDVNLVGQSSKRDMEDMSKYLVFIRDDVQVDLKSKKMIDISKNENPFIFRNGKIRKARGPHWNVEY